MEALVRETKRRVLSLMHNVSYRTKRKRMNSLLEGYDPSPVFNRVPPRRDTIAFVITRMVRFHGGQTSVLRLGTQLAGLGMNVKYLVYKPQSIKEMEVCASSNLSGYKGDCVRYEEYLREAEESGEGPGLVCATSWDTVSKVKAFKNAYKMYFVQDYEPYFYEFGEEFLMAKDTYLQGLHMVSLGEWNRRMILKECAQEGAAGELKIDAVSFPCEKSEYVRGERDYAAYPGKKKLTLAVYVKFYGKRLPNLIPFMLQNTAKTLKEHGIETEVLYFGEAKTFKAAGGRNLGHLSREELAELYRRADFGMVASMSNISLVPYEMHAAGLPVIEFGDGTYKDFFTGGSAVLTRIGETDIAGKLLEVMKNPEELARMQKAADETMKDLSWERTGREFYEIIQNIGVKLS